MNVENGRKLVEHLGSEECPIGFGMKDWFIHNDSYVFVEEIVETVENHSCGTTACIAGHAAYLALREGWTAPEGRTYSIRQIAAEWLGLGYEEALRLFLGHWMMGYTASATAAEASVQLERMMEESG